MTKEREPFSVPSTQANHFSVFCGHEKMAVGRGQSGPARRGRQLRFSDDLAVGQGYAFQKTTSLPSLRIGRPRAKVILTGKNKRFYLGSAKVRAPFPAVKTTKLVTSESTRAMNVTTAHCDPK